MSASKARLHPALLLLIIVLTVFALDRVVGAALKAVVRSSDYRISRLYAGAAKADVLLMGNSVGNAMAIPRDLERDLHHSVFSLAAHGMDARTQQAFVMDLIDRGGAPKVAVLEIRPVLSPTLQAPAFSTYQSFSPRLATLLLEAQTDPVPWPRIFQVYAFNSPELANVLQKVVDRDDQDTGPSNGKINRAMKDRWRAKPTLPKVVPNQLEAFVETVDALRSAGSTVIVLAAPINPVTRTRGPWMQAVATQVRDAMPEDVAVIDCSAALDADRYFEDPVHINNMGRSAFRPLMAAAIQQGLEVHAAGAAQSFPKRPVGQASGGCVTVGAGQR